MGAEEDDRKGLKLSDGPRPDPAPGGAGGSVWIGGRRQRGARGRVGPDFPRRVFA